MQTLVGLFERVSLAFLRNEPAHIKKQQKQSCGESEKKGNSKAAKFLDEIRHPSSEGSRRLWSVLWKVSVIQ